MHRHPKLICSAPTTNNTSCIGLPAPWCDYANESMKDVSLQTIYNSYSQSRDVEQPSGINPHPAASWRAKYDYTLVLWKTAVRKYEDEKAVLVSANKAFLIELEKKHEEIAALRKELTKLQLPTVAIKKEEVPTDPC
jgi:hypothetical protein